MLAAPLSDLWPDLCPFTHLRPHLRHPQPQPSGPLTRSVPLSPQLDRGLLSLTVTRGSGRAAHLLLDQVTVSDGKWHDLRLELQEEPGGRRGHHVLMVSLDFSLFQV